MKSRLILVLLVCLTAPFLASRPLPAAAQNSVEQECAEFVMEVEATIEQICPKGAVGACYVHGPIEFEAQPDSDATFENRGDRVALEDILSIHTGPVNIEAQEWGIATLDMPGAAEESDDADAENTEDAEDVEEELTRFLLMGDVTINRLEATDDIDAFSVSTAEDEPECKGAPNKLVLETPSGITANFALNGAIISMSGGTIIVVEAQPDNSMTIMLVIGSGSVTAMGQTLILVAGQQTILLLGGATGLVVITGPGEPTIFSFVVIQFIPFQALVTTVEVPSVDRWTPTGVELEAGQTYLLIASGLVRTIETMPWTGPEGHSEADCAAAGRYDWGDCKCRTLPEWGTCTVDGLDCMQLVGSIDDGTPFSVGSGGFFTANTAGELMLGPNDNEFDDNVGAFHAIIVAVDQEPDTDSE